MLFCISPIWCSLLPWPQCSQISKNVEIMKHLGTSSRIKFRLVPISNIKFHHLGWLFVYTKIKQLSHHLIFWVIVQREPSHKIAESHVYVTFNYFLTILSLKVDVFSTWAAVLAWSCLAMFFCVSGKILTYLDPKHLPFGLK